MGIFFEINEIACSTQWLKELAVVYRDTTTNTKSSNGNGFNTPSSRVNQDFNSSRAADRSAVNQDFNSSRAAGRSAVNQDFNSSRASGATNNYFAEYPPGTKPQTMADKMREKQRMARIKELARININI